jgi:phenylalanyl-tRNA synthetase alpha chain
MYEREAIMIKKLDTLFEEFQKKLKALNSTQEILNLKSDYISKKGQISQVLKSLKDATPEERKIIGPKANNIKDQIQDFVANKLEELEMSEINAKLAKNKVDISFTDSIRALGQQGGGCHPITAIQREIEDIFLSMGFEILDGPHIEDEYHNFEALNIPADHPARDMQDTFWFKSDKKENKPLLRTHTSCIQIRGMKTRKPPFKFIAPGKVFRCERTDASHEMVFHQLEGMLVGENISVGNLIYFMKTLLSEVFGKKMDVRLRPGFFPFVEPGFELDIKCLICSGKGCSVCKQVGWVELLPCGMVHPNVLKAGGIDTTKYNGFAFGMGLDRLVMMRYGIDDIRHFQSGDLRFVSQFKSY